MNDKGPLKSPSGSGPGGEGPREGSRGESQAPDSDASSRRRGQGAPAAGAGVSGQAPSGKGARSGSRRALGLVLPLGLVLLFLAAGAYWYLEIRGVIETDDAAVDGDRMVVSTKAFGRIAQLGADEGDTVQEGELLVQLDDVDIRARVAQAEARLTLAEKNVDLADVTVQKAEDDFHRAQVQYDGQAIPKEQLDHARSALSQAQAQQAIALAQVETARADLDVVQTQLQDTQVRSPFSGVVAKRWVLQGEVVQPGQPVLTLYNLSDVWVTAYFEETKLRSIPLGARAQLSVDAYPNETLYGRVILIGAAAASQFSLIPPNNASGNFTKVTQRIPVRIGVDEEASGTQSGAGAYHGLLPGMSVVVTILQGDNER